MKRLSLICIAALVGAFGCASATVTYTPTPATELGAPPAVPDAGELDRLVDVMSFDDAVLRYGKPIVVDESHEFMHVEWHYGEKRGEDCKLRLSFSSVTTRLSTFRFGCE